ncbi:hypothetical protein KC19_N001800 [Ceratodon purpureus]|nr:hypothetical protein KC19_N001800 [Ceratodon purpureus]
MPGLLVGAVPDVGHQGDALELTTDPRVDTLWPPPVYLDANLAVRLHALELLDALLDDIALDERGHHGEGLRSATGRVG